MRVQIPIPRAPLDQVTIVQQTQPVPTVNQPDRSRVDAYLQAARYIVLAAVAIHQGATVQATQPPPPVTTNPSARYYTADPNRIALGSGNVGPDQQLDGATSQRTDPTPPVSQPELRYWTRYDPNRVALGGGNVGPDPQLDGATRLSTDPVPPVAQPEFRYWLRHDPNRIALGGGNVGPDSQFDGATAQATFLFPVGQPLVLVAPRAPLPPTQRIDVASVGVTQTDVYPLPEPTSAWWTRPDPNRLTAGPVPQLAGATMQATFLFPPNQPELIACALRDSVARRLGGPITQVDGATVQPSSVFQPNQPELTGWARLDLARRLGGPATQTDGATNQQTYLFPVSQPVLVPPRLQVPVSSRVDPAPTVIIPSDVFTISQPEFTSWGRLELARRLGGPTPQTSGATQQATFVFPPSQPPPQWYVRVPQPGLAQQLDGVATLTYSQLVRANGAFAHWRFDDAQAGNLTFPLTDVISGYNGSATSAAGLTPQQPGALIDGDTSAKFDGAAATFYTVPDSPGFHLTGACSWDCWFKIPVGTSGSTRVLGIFTADSLTFLDHKFNGGQITGSMNIGGAQVSITVSPTAVPSIGAWHYVAMTYDGTTLRLYLDGYQIGSTPASGAVSLGTSGLTFGTNSTSTPVGYVDESSLYTGALSAAQVLQQFRFGLAQQSYEFTPNQPEQVAFALRREWARRLGGPQSQLDGPTVQDWFIYPVKQPERIAYANRETARRLGGPTPQTTGPTTQAWFLYPPNQPEFRRWTLPDVNRTEVPGPTMQVSGATSQQTYIFDPSQPEFRYYLRVTPATAPVPVLGVFVRPFNPQWAMNSNVVVNPGVTE